MATPTSPGGITPPTPRRMDSYSPAESAAFADKERDFFAGHPSTPDTVIEVLSPFGKFKIDSYPNPSVPADIHYVVFFSNNATKETFEVHGTLARAYLDLVRNRSGVTDFPIADTRHPVAEPRGDISYFSAYSLRWVQATNAVIKKFYKPYDPARASNPAKVHEFDPVDGNTLVGYSEEYPIASDALTFKNWKDVADLGKYNPSIGVRTVGMPSQILLHETAGFGDLSIAGIRKSAEGDFLIPHFCVNNLDAKGKGSILQFVDVATKVFHGEHTNNRAVGIEFVNAPFESFTRDRPPRPIFNLVTSDRGVYLQTKLPARRDLFIPLEFATEAGDSHHELRIKKDKVLNLAALKAGVGPDKKKVVEETGDEVVLKFVKSGKFEHLAALVSALVGNKLVKGIDDLAKEEFWRPVMRVDGKPFYIFENGWLPNRKAPSPFDIGSHFFVNPGTPGLLTHVLIGGHGDGATQCLYLYLKFVRRVPVASILQVLVDLLTSARTPAETAGFTLRSTVVLVDGVGYRTPQHPMSKKFTSIVELDEALIEKAAAPAKPAAPSK